MEPKTIIIKKPGKTILVVSDSSITITRKGILNTLNHGLKGEKTIPFKNITAIQLKEPGFTNGYLQFSVLGGNESKGGINAAVSDENTIMFIKKDLEIIKKLKRFIEKRQEEIANDSVTINNNQPLSQAEQIKEFKELLDLGIITRDEFEKKKVQILNN